MSVDLCVSKDFKHDPPTTYEEGVVKSVRFSEKPNIKEYDSNPNDNILVKEDLPLHDDEVKKHTYGFYAWDSNKSIESYRANTLFNALSTEVNDRKHFKSFEFIPNAKVQKFRVENYMDIYPNPVKFVTSRLLIPPAGSSVEKEIDKYPRELVISSIIDIMDILNKLDNGVPFVCISYGDGVSISNRPGKDQRPPVRKILQKMIDHLCILNSTSCTCIQIPISQPPVMAVLVSPPTQDMDLLLFSSDDEEDDCEI